jgi:GDP-L-fucose synthase
MTCQPRAPQEVLPLDAKIYVAGHEGLVGSALIRTLHTYGYHDLVTRTHQELDLRNQVAVNAFFAQERPEYVFLAAAKVGGIIANDTYPAEFIYDNLAISAHVIHASYTYGVKKLLFLGSSCIYPRLCPQPIKEEYLLSGLLESTNEAYAIAKIAGIKLCQSYNRQYGTHFIACMPTNLYGPHDNYNLQNAHVIPSMIAKMHQAKIRGDKQVTIWGSGIPYREFLYVDDLADACIFLMRHYDDAEIINVGTGRDVTITALAHLIKTTIGFEGELVFDTTKPDGTPRKLLDVSKLTRLGWQATTSLEEGLRQAYSWYAKSSI